MHSRCKSVFVSVADFLRDLRKDPDVPEDIKARAKLVAGMVIYAGHGIVDMELASRDAYKGARQ